MGKVDRLSRRVDWKIRVDKDNENQIFIKDNWIRSMYEVVLWQPLVTKTNSVTSNKSLKGEHPVGNS